MESEGGHIVTYLCPHDLLLVEMHQAKTTAAIQAVALARQRIEALDREYQAKVHTARMDLAASIAHGSALEAKCSRMWRAMSDVYGLDFSKAAYSDETGKINLLPEINDNG